MGGGARKKERRFQLKFFLPHRTHAYPACFDELGHQFIDMMKRLLHSRTEKTPSVYFLFSGFLQYHWLNFT